MIAASRARTGGYMLSRTRVAVHRREAAIRAAADPVADQLTSVADQLMSGDKVVRLGESMIT